MMNFKYSSMNIQVYILSCLAILLLFYAPCVLASPIDREIFRKKHPRIFLTENKKISVQRNINGSLEPVYRLFTRYINKEAKIPRRIVGLKTFIYREGFLYQVTGDEKHANNVIMAMERFPSSIKAYGGLNNGYGHAIEALSIGFDWCYDQIIERGKKELFVELINSYMEGNLENLQGLPDFHNYASQGQVAILVAGLATYGDNDKAFEYIDLARRVMETGDNTIRNGVLFNVRRSMEAVNGTANWEGVTYGRRTLFNSMKYCDALNTATNGKLNPWKTSFKNLENAGYYIMYSLRPDNIFESLGDVNWPGIMTLDINNMAMLQSTFNNRYFTSFINKYYRITDKSFDPEIRIRGNKASLTFYLLYFDPNVENGELEDLPNTMRFGGTVIIRTGFSPQDTFIAFKSGFHWGFHSQLDHGTFTIYKDSPLVIDSGFYDNWKWGKRHNWNYWKRTVAHNTLIVYNKEDQLINYPKKYERKLVNDGGQRFAFMRFFPKYKSRIFKRTFGYR